jgi:hypothetical protein
MNDETTITLLNRRIQQCRVERRAFEMWLARLTPLRWATISGSVILSAIAGATALNDPVWPGNSAHWVSGSCALLAAVLTGLHTAFKCEAHQAECHRMVRFYSSHILAYEAAYAGPREELDARIAALDVRLQEEVLNASASVPVKYRDRAESVERDAALASNKSSHHPR